MATYSKIIQEAKKKAGREDMREGLSFLAGYQAKVSMANDPVSSEAQSGTLTDDIHPSGYREKKQP